MVLLGLSTVQATRRWPQAPRPAPASGWVRAGKEGRAGATWGPGVGPRVSVATWRAGRARVSRPDAHALWLAAGSVRAGRRAGPCRPISNRNKSAIVTCPLTGPGSPAPRPHSGRDGHRDPRVPAAGRFRTRFWRGRASGCRRIRVTWGWSAQSHLCPRVWGDAGPGNQGPRWTAAAPPGEEHRGDSGSLWPLRLPQRGHLTGSFL